MMREPLSLLEKRVLVLGLGDTGLSVARWVERQGGRVRAADTRDAPPRAGDYRGELHTGRFSEALLEDVDLVCISPGLSLDQPVVQAARARGVPVLGDVELFARHVGAKVIAVTGTNGKSTVTALTGHLLRAAGLDCEVAGNIAPPVLEALMRRLGLPSAPPAAWVLELSSYQLETTWSLEPHAAAMLNLSEDHLDRYRGLDEYGAAKARVFAGGGVQVLICPVSGSSGRAPATAGAHIERPRMSSPRAAVRLSIASDGSSSTVDPSVDTSSPLRRHFSLMASA